MDDDGWGKISEAERKHAQVNKAKRVVGAAFKIYLWIIIGLVIVVIILTAILNRML